VEKPAELSKVFTPYGECVRGFGGAGLLRGEALGQWGTRVATTVCSDLANSPYSLLI